MSLTATAPRQWSQPLGLGKLGLRSDYYDQKNWGANGEARFSATRGSMTALCVLLNKHVVLFKDT